MVGNRIGGGAVTDSRQSVASVETTDGFRFELTRLPSDGWLLDVYKNNGSRPVGARADSDLDWVLALASNFLLQKEYAEVVAKLVRAATGKTKDGVGVWVCYFVDYFVYIGSIHESEQAALDGLDQLDSTSYVVGFVPFDAKIEDVFAEQIAIDRGERAGPPGRDHEVNDA